MSYILDALRKADAERELGRVPGLHAQPLPGAMPGPGRSRGDDDDGPAGGWHTAARWWPLVAGALLALLGLGAAGWMAWREPAPAAPPTGVVMPPPAPVATAPAPPPSPASSPQVAAPLAAAAPAAAAARPARPEARSPTDRPREPAPERAPVRPPEARTAPRPAPPAAAAAVPTLEALDPAARSTLPALSIGGAVHSADPASRMLIVNGILAREGDTVAGGLLLERIGPRSAVLRRGDLRFSIRY